MNARARLKPAGSPAGRRALGLIRVSKEKDGGVSPDNQRHAIEQYAAQERITIVDWVEGVDETKYSGSRRKSAWWPKLDSAIDRLEAGEVDTLIVWKFSRTARNRLRWAVALDRVDVAGGSIVSATEHTDNTPSGRFARGMLGEMNAYYAEMTGEVWKEVQDRRVRQGLTPNGQYHFGYSYSRDHGYRIDPIEGPLLAGMYQAYAAGESGWQIADRLNGPAPQAGPRHARWNTASVLRVLDSGFGAGLVLFRGQLHPGAHESVIDTDDWNRYLHAREARRRRPRAERSPYLYSGFIWCHCGGKMGGRTDHGRPRYACIQSATYKPHPDASLAAHIIDDAVKGWLQTIRDELNESARRAPRRPRLVADPAKDIARKLTAATERLDSATMKFVDGAIPADVYERLRSRLQAELNQLDHELTRVNAQATLRPVAFVGDLVAQWDELPIERRREALRLLIDRIIVNEPDAATRVTVISALARS